MKQKFFRRYRSALLHHLKQNGTDAVQRTRGMGKQAHAAGMQTLDIAKVHEQILVTDVLPRLGNVKRTALIKKAGIFFTEAIAPAPIAKLDPRKAARHLNKVVEMLSQRTVDLAASNLSLEMEIVQRKAVESALKKSEHHYSQLLGESDRMQQELRQLSRRILSAQEDERKEISRELHDVIAQSLSGINVRLAALAKDATSGTKDIERNIARTQKLITASVDIVHRFARELRPAVLDDLGLIAALHTFLKAFTERTGVRTSLTAFAKIETLDTPRRTALFRVAQEALTNVHRHAKASQVKVSIEQLNGNVVMRVEDDGRSFKLAAAMDIKKNKRLGLLGMRERIEMIGGKFSVETDQGNGTTVIAHIPFRKNGKH